MRAGRGGRPACRRQACLPQAGLETRPSLRNRFEAKLHGEAAETGLATEEDEMTASSTPGFQPTEEWLYRQMLEQTLGVAAIYADHEGIIRLWSAGAEAMFSFTAREAIGQSLDIIVPEKHRDTHWAGWRRVMRTGVTKYGRDVLAVPAVTKDGRRISVEFYIALVRSPAGEIVGASALMMDVTKRWQEQKQLRARLAEAEASLARADPST
jgi:PAS domain S-box-containing protein